MPLPPPNDLARALRGPHPVLPRPLDALAERWARLPPRVRSLVTIATIAALLLGMHARIEHAEARWGGTPVRVLVAASDLTVGTVPDVTAVVLPPAAVPPEALTELPQDTVLTLALPEGSVLTRRHVDPSGPAAGLDEDLRAVPLPIEDGWGVAPGGWVDVWVLGGGEEPARLVAQGRPVLEIRAPDGADATALVGLADIEVEDVTGGLALGRVLLTHVPGPVRVESPR